MVRLSESVVNGSIFARRPNGAPPSFMSLSALVFRRATSMPPRPQRAGPARDGTRLSRRRLNLAQLFDELALEDEVLAQEEAQERGHHFFPAYVGAEDLGGVCPVRRRSQRRQHLRRGDLLAGRA